MNDNSRTRWNDYTKGEMQYELYESGIAIRLEGEGEEHNPSPPGSDPSRSVMGQEEEEL